MEAPDLNADRRDGRQGSGISLQTLIIASIASAVASFAVSRIWGAGTLISAAATPVIVALVAEFLRRPVQTVAATAKKVPTVQTLPVARKRTFAAPGDSTRVLEDPAQITTDPPARDEPRPAAGEPHAGRAVEPPGHITPVVDPGRSAPAEAGAWRPHWSVVVVTGLLAFAIVVAVYTVPDLVAGSSITGNGQATTFFGGSATVEKQASPPSTVRTVTTVTKSGPATTTQTGTTQTTTPTTRTGTTPTITATTPTTTQPITGTTPAVNPTTTSSTPG